MTRRPPNFSMMGMVLYKSYKRIPVKIWPGINTNIIPKKRNYSDDSRTEAESKFLGQFSWTKIR